MAIEQQNAVGMTDGRASALTVVLPLEWWGRRWLTIWFAALRTRRGRRFAFETSLDPLRFISAIRWSLLPPFDPPRLAWWRRPPSERWHLLFESNFDGDWDEYLDNFGAVMARPLASIIRAGLDYPGLATRGMFKAYAKAYDNTPEHYVSAYPRLAAGDIRQELLARDPSGADRKRIVHDGFGRTEPQWSTFLLPIVAGRTGDAVKAARDFDPMTSPGDGPEQGTAKATRHAKPARSAALLVNGRVHFARIVVITRSERSWLLLTMTHDGPIEPTLHELVALEAERVEERAAIPYPASSSGTDDPYARSRWRVLLEETVGVPIPSDRWWDDERLVEHLLAHRPESARRCLTYCGYPGTTVEDIQGYRPDRKQLTRWPAGEDAS